MARNKFDVDETLEKDAEFSLPNLLRMRKYIGPYKNQLFTTLLAMLVSSVFSLISPTLFRILIDESIPNRDIQSILVMTAIFLVTQVLNILFLKYKIQTMTKVGQGIIRDLRLDLFTHMQKLPFSYYDSRPHGKILVRVVNYINSLSDMFSNGIVNLVTELFSLVIVLAMMLATDTKLTLVSLAGLPLLIITINIIKTLQRKAWRVNSAKQSNMNAYIHESIAGMKVTQAFVREQTNRDIFQNVTGDVRRSWMNAVKIAFMNWPAIDNISTWTTSLLYFCGVVWLTDANVTLGVLIAMVSYAGRFWIPIANIANFYNSIIVNMAYMERIFETLDEPVVVDDRPGAGVMPDITGAVTFENVTFSYDPGRPILKNVSFSVAPGDTIALVGPTGAGKTTVVNLISRFYDIESGRVLLDGTDITSVTLNSLRKQMGIMLQDSFIFSGTIMDNIRYGKLDATDEEVIAASKAVRAHEFIMDMEKGYETEVNERGSRLSVGQRQLISFARALLADPKILILDEATSSIDTKTEKALQEGLDRLLTGRTSFIIAHRLSTIRNATRIMYIDKGTICEAGNHDELMEQQGAYYNLYTAQYTFLNSL